MEPGSGISLQSQSSKNEKSFKPRFLDGKLWWMTKFGAAENEMERLTAKFAQRTPTEHSLLKNFKFSIFTTLAPILPSVSTLLSSTTFTLCGRNFYNFLPNLKFQCVLTFLCFHSRQCYIYSLLWKKLQFSPHFKVPVWTDVEGCVLSVLIRIGHYGMESTITIHD